MTPARSAFGAPLQEGDTSGPAEPAPRRPLAWLDVLPSVLGEDCRGC